MEFTHTMFDYDFGGVTPQDCLTIKAMTAEELYVNVLASIEEFNSFTWASSFCLKPYNVIKFHVGELFRRNISSLFPIVSSLFDPGYPDGPNPHKVEQTLSSLKQFCKEQLDLIKRVKPFMMKLLKAPLLSKQINDLMDEILDKNGNKPSQFKDFLTPDHYRMVRMGCDVSVWSVEEQEVLLACLKKM
jgi:hypothetical protein